MAGIEVLPKEYGYVILVLVAYIFFNMWMIRQVVKARYKYDVPYPALYAVESENKNAKLFNCVQRGHQNTLEVLPTFCTTMALAGIKHPYICSFIGCFYIITRYFYFVGYASGIPENRLPIGKFAFISLVGLLPCTISAGVSLLRG